MFAPRITQRRLADFCRQLGMMLHAGVDIRKSLQQEADNARGHHRLVVQQIAIAARSGHSLSDGLSAAGSYFPQLVQAMVVVGEHTGHLDQVLIELGKHYERLEATRKALIAALVRPMIQLVIALGIIGAIIWISGVISVQTKMPVDILGLGLVGMPGLAKYGAIILGTVVTITATISAMRRGLLGGGAFFRLVRRIPILGDTLRNFSLGRFAWSLALTTNTSMGLDESLRIAFESAGDPALMDCLPNVLQGIRQGKEIHTCLTESGQFPFEFIAPLEVGETTGMLSEGAERLSQQYSESAQRSLQTLSSIAGTIVWLMIMGIIAFMILKMATGYVHTIQSFIP